MVLFYDGDDYGDDGYDDGDDDVYIMMIDCLCMYGEFKNIVLKVMLCYDSDNDIDDV